jgi:nucleoside-diphosphate-sugar epimerase
MKELGVRKGIHTSSIAVFADTGGEIVDENFFHSGYHVTEYARTKWIAHYDVARTMVFDGLPLVIVQPGIVYGPGDHSVIADMMTAFLRRRLPFAPADFSVSWAHIDDIVLGHYRAMTQGRAGETYLLTGPSHTLYDALAEVARLVRRRPPPIRLGHRRLLAASRFVRLVEGFVPVPPHLSSEVLRMCAGKSLTASSAKAERELGYASRSLSSGLKGTVTDLITRITGEKTLRQGR